MLESIFKNKIANVEKLLSFGFIETECSHVLKKSIMDNQFEVEVVINSAFEIVYKVIDLSLGEEYLPIKVESFNGAFVNSVRKAVKDAFQEIADSCFDCDEYCENQKERVLLYIKNKYGVVPEYLWNDGKNAAIRHNDEKKKWFACLMELEGKKISKSKCGTVTVMDFKAKPERVAELVDDESFFPGFHMNKKHWYTVVLDGSVKDELIYSAIDESFEITR